MKLGFVSSILDGWTFDEMIEVASKTGFECVEVACWENSGESERRYAGVCHIDTERLTKEKGEKILRKCESKNIEISSLAFYPNTLDSNVEKRKANIKHLHSIIDAAALLKVNMVTTFIGRDQNKTVEENLELVKHIWPDIIKHAEDKGVKIAIENCPMLFGEDQWPGGQNLMTSPENWDKIFEILDSPNIGLNFDPSHFVWQQMDYIAPIYKYKEKLFHVHFKDLKVYKEKLAQVGILGYPLDYMSPKLPGLGDVDWSKFISALTDVGYDGYACIEIEDKAFESSKEKIIESIVKSREYIKQFPM